MPKRKAEQGAEEADKGSDRADEPEHSSEKKVKTKEGAKKKGDGSGVSNKIDLGNRKYIDVRDFRGSILIDIREYYEAADGEMRPGKKGIALKPEQWEKLKDSMKEINDKIDALQ